MTFNVYNIMLFVISSVTFLLISKFSFVDLIKKQKYIIDIILIIVSLIPIISFIKLIFFQSAALRFSGLIGDIVFEADFATAVLFFLISYLIFQKHNRILTLFYLISSFLIFVYVFELKSRTSYVSIFFLSCILLYFIIQSRKKINFKLHIITFSIILCFSVLMSEYIPLHTGNRETRIKENIFSIFQSDYHSNIARIMFWNASIKMFLEHPLTGVGAGQWSGEFPKYYGEKWNDSNVDINSSVFAHNDFLQMLAEFGIGGVFYFLFVICGLYNLYKKSHNNNFYISFFFAGISLFISSLFNSVIFNFYNFIFLTIILGTGYGELIIVLERRFKIKMYKPKIIFLIFIILIIFITLTFKNFFENRYIIAMKYKAENKYVEMIDELETIPEYFYSRDMNEMPLDYYSGVGYFELKQYEIALSKFKNARTYMKYYPTIMNNEASALFMSGRNEEAENLYLEIKNIFPNYYEPQINLLAMYANLKMDKKALELLDDINKKITSLTFDLKKIKNIQNYYNIKEFYLNSKK